MVMEGLGGGSEVNNAELGDHILSTGTSTPRTPVTRAGPQQRVGYALIMVC